MPISTMLSSGVVKEAEHYIGHMLRKMGKHGDGCDLMCESEVTQKVRKSKDKVDRKCRRKTGTTIKCMVRKERHHREWRK